MIIVRIAFVLLIVAIASAVAAQFPAKPIRIIVPFSAGSADTTARLVTQKIFENTGRSFIVDNKSGAGGRIAFEAAAKSQGDGHTYLMMDASYTYLPTLYKNLAWDPADLVPVTLVLQMPFVVVTGATTRISSMAELLGQARAHPGKLNFGSAGNGGTNHISTEMFKIAAGVEMAHIPYRGMGEAMTALLGGSVQMLISTIAVASGNLKGGTVVPLMVPSAKRSAALPNVPTATEVGLPGFQVSNWLGLLAPKSTPTEAIDWMQKQVAAAVATREIRERFDMLGVEASGMSTADFGKFLRDEGQRWTESIRAAGIKVE